MTTPQYAGTSRRPEEQALIGMGKETFRKRLERNRVLPAVRDEDGLRKALHAPQDILFVLYGDILTLDSVVATILKAGKTPFVHLDMIQGLANNLVVLDFFLQHFRRDCGVITTKLGMSQEGEGTGACP